MPATRTNEPDVIFDVVFEGGLLFFELSNRADVPATKVVTQFRRPVIGPDGVTDLTRLAVFRRVSFMPPGKAIRVFVDTVAGYFARRQPPIIGVVLSWSRAGTAMTTTISHDLGIYRDLPYVVSHDGEVRRGVPIGEPTRRRRR